MNQSFLDEIKKQDYDSIQNKIGTFLVEEVSQRQALGVVFGLSGGIDSAVIAVLCSKFLKDKSLALIMPDSKATPKIDTEDDIKLVDKLGIDYELINKLKSIYFLT